MAPFCPPYYSVSNNPFRTRSRDSYFLPTHVSLEQWLHGIKPVALSVHWDWIHFREGNSINQEWRAETERQDECEVRNLCEGGRLGPQRQSASFLCDMADSFLSTERLTTNQSGNGSKAVSHWSSCEICCTRYGRNFRFRRKCESKWRFLFLQLDSGGQGAWGWRASRSLVVGCRHGPCRHDYLTGGPNYLQLCSSLLRTVQANVRGIVCVISRQILSHCCSELRMPYALSTQAVFVRSV